MSSALLTNLADDFGGGVLPTLQNIRGAIAAAIAPQHMLTESVAAVNKVPRGAAQSFTLTAPLEKAPASTAGTPSGEDASGSGAVSTADPSTGTTDPSGEATQTNKGNLKGGNLFTPGASATKGGRHRAETGSFAQGLRDAAEKTIKGITGLGHSTKSEDSSSAAKGSESASSSSGSAESGAGGGSGTK